MELLLIDDDITTELIQLCLQIFKPDITLTVLKDGLEALWTFKEAKIDANSGKLLRLCRTPGNDKTIFRA